MTFFQQLADFFQTLFGAKKNENSRQPQLKKLEVALSKMDPPLYKNGEVQPVVGKAFSILYKNTSIIYKILDFMVSSEDMRIRNRVFDTLIQTGYVGKAKEIFDSLSYETRKKKLEHCGNQQHELETQGHMFIELQKELKSNTFAQIEQTLKNLELFYDLCNFNFLSVLKIFDDSFDTMDSDNTFSPTPIEKLGTTFFDLYYVTAKLELNGSLARAIIALISIVPDKKGICAPDDVMQSIKKIAAILNKILTKEVLENFITLTKGDDSDPPDFLIIKKKLLEDYSQRARARFNSDEERLMVELQTQQLDRGIKKLFGNYPLLTLKGYNSQNDATLKSGLSVAFLWITPMQVIKTFIAHFFEEQVQGLLNDIILEGFFTKPEQKTEFSTTVFACQDTERLLEEFESSFARESKNDIVLLFGYLRDSQKDAEFSRSLTHMVNTINVEAKNFVQKQASCFYALHKLILQLCDDAHKATPESISNIKFLFTSSRNRERVGFLEKSLPQWASFLSLLKNYAVLGQVEVSREESRQQNNLQKKQL